ncbi:MAG: proline dehydrogenase family protein [Acidobacteriota bacterium]|nr:proline dehydrogenase family protein [Acidobacteriota bacterium]
MALRRTLLYLSGHAGLRRWMETSALAQRLSSRFIAGDTLDHALDVCRKIRGEGIVATFDYLGENVRSIGEAAACRDMYLRMLAALHAAGLEPNVSLKLTQFGLDLSPEACETNVGMLVEEASRIGGFVRIDMESSHYTDRTLAIVARLHERFGACGTVIQAYLRRSAADITDLNAKCVRVRLCKGAYLEPEEVAFPSKEEVDANYLALAGKLLSGGAYPAIATHDERMIAGARKYAAEHGIGKSKFEFQMLYGIRRDLQKQLVADGYRLRLYVPFGEAWYPYFMRRLAERPANLLFLLRNLFR